MKVRFVTAIGSGWRPEMHTIVGKMEGIEGGTGGSASNV